MTLTNDKILVVNGFPVRNDGELVYDKNQKQFILDVPHMLLFTKACAFCASHYEYGYIVDDRAKKSPKSNTKDDIFVRNHPGVADYYDERQLSLLISTAIAKGTIQKCAINYGVGYQRDVDEDKTDNQMLIFTMIIPGSEYYTNEDVYVKVRFTNKTSLRLHVISVHQ